MHIGESQRELIKWIDSLKKKGVAVCLILGDK